MKYLFGWSNIKFIVKELIKIYSGEKSYFSKKRIESGIAFVIFQWGMIYFLKMKIDTMDMYEMTLWAGIEATVSGYMLDKIQKEKKINASTDE